MRNQTMTKTVVAVVFLMVLILSSSPPAMADDKYFDNEGGTWQWGDYRNWDPDGVPGSVDSAIFPAGGASCDQGYAYGEVNSIELSAGYNGLVMFQDIEVIQYVHVYGGRLVAGNYSDIYLQGDLSILPAGSLEFSGVGESVLYLTSDTSQTISINGTYGTNYRIYNLEKTGSGYANLTSITEPLRIETNFTQTAGTFDDGAHGLNVFGNFTLGPGTTYDHGGSLTVGGINIDPGAAFVTSSPADLTVRSINAASIYTPGVEFNNLFLGAHVTGTETITSNMTVNNDLTVTNYPGSSGLPVTFNGSGSPVIDVGGDLDFPDDGVSRAISFGGTTPYNISVNLEGDLNLLDPHMTIYPVVNFIGTEDQAFNYTAGTVSENGGAWTVNKSSGTMTFPDYTLNIPITITDGTIAGTIKTKNVFTTNGPADVTYVNGSSVNFEASGATTALDIHTNGAEFYDLNFNKTGTNNSPIIRFYDDFTVKNDVTAKSSYALSGYHVRKDSANPVTMTIEGDLSFPSSSGAGFYFGNNTEAENITVDLGGDLDLSSSNAHLQANMNFVGSGDQAFTYSAGYVDGIGTWTVDKASGTMTFSPNYVMTRPINITNGTIAGPLYTVASLTANSPDHVTFDTTSTVNLWAYTSNIDLDTNGAAFYNLNFNKTAGYSSPAVTLYDDFTVANDVVVQNNYNYDYFIYKDSLNPMKMTIQGDLDFPSTPSASLVYFGHNTNAAYNPTVDLEGSLYMSDAGTRLRADMNFTGTGDQVFTYSAGTIDSGNWTVDKASGTMTFPSNLIIQRPLDIKKGTIDGTLNVGLRAYGAVFRANGPSPSDVTYAEGSTVTLWGNTDYNYDVDTNGAEFYNLTFNKTGFDTTPTIRFYDSFTVANDVTVENNYNSGSSGINIFKDTANPNMKMTINGDLNFPNTAATKWLLFGNTNANDNLTVDLYKDLTMSDAEVRLRANINFKGAGDHVITKTAGFIDYGTWILDGDGGSVTLASPISKAGPVNIIKGTFNTGGNNLTLTDSGGSPWLAGVATVGPQGILKGYGTVTQPSGTTFTNSGKVIADGAGTENTLTLGGYTTFAAAENTTDLGWYAQNKGKLTLPSISVASGSPTVNWGETTADTTIDLVNSARLEFHGISGGTLAGSLLSLDRNDIPDWKADLGEDFEFIGAWLFSGVNFGTGNVDITLRYDPEMAEYYNINEDELKVYHYYQKDGVYGWYEENTLTPDTTNKLVKATGLTSFSPIVLGANGNEPPGEVPEPSTIVISILGLFPMAFKWLKRRIK